MNHSFQLERSDVDSRRFGRNIGRTYLEDPLGAGLVVTEFIASDLEILILRYEASHLSVFSDLVHDDVVVIHAGTLCYFEGRLPDDRSVVEDHCYLVSGRPTVHQDVGRRR